MNPETPTRKLSLRRKRPSRGESNGVSSKRILPSYFNAEKCSKNEDDISIAFVPELIESNSDLPNSRRTPRNHFTLGGNLSSTPILSHDASSTSNGSPEFEFCSSQILGTPYCEVVWDCNTPGYSKEDLKKMSIRASGPSPSPISEEASRKQSSKLLRSRLPSTFERCNSTTNNDILINELDKLKSAINLNDERSTDMENDSFSSENECTSFPQMASSNSGLKRSTRLNFVTETDANSQFKTPSKISRYKPGIQVSLERRNLKVDEKVKIITNSNCPSTSKQYSNNIKQVTSDGFDDLPDDSFIIPDDIILGLACKVESISNPSDSCALSINNKTNCVLNVDESKNSLIKLPLIDDRQLTGKLKLKNGTPNSAEITTDINMNGSDLFDDDLINDSFLLSTQILEDQFYNKNNYKNKPNTKPSPISKSIKENKSSLNLKEEANSICKKLAECNEKLSLTSCGDLEIANSEFCFPKPIADHPTNKDTSPILGKAHKSPVSLNSSYKNNSYRNLFGDKHIDNRPETILKNSSEIPFTSTKTGKFSQLKPSNSAQSHLISTIAKNSLNEFPGDANHKSSRISFQLGDPLKKKTDKKIEYKSSKEGKFIQKSALLKDLNSDKFVNVNSSQSSLISSREKLDVLSSSLRPILSKGNFDNYKNKSKNVNLSQSSHLTSRSKSEVHLTSNASIPSLISKGLKKNISCSDEKNLIINDDFENDDDEFVKTFLNSMENEDLCNLNRSMSETEIKEPLLNDNGVSNENVPLRTEKDEHPKCTYTSSEVPKRFKFISNNSSSQGENLTVCDFELHRTMVADDFPFSPQSIYPTPENNNDQNSKKSSEQLDQFRFNDEFDDESFELDVFDHIDQVESEHIEMTQRGSRSNRCAANTKTESFATDNNREEIVLPSKEIKMKQHELNASETPSILSRTLFPIKFELEGVGKMNHTAIKQLPPSLSFSQIKKKEEMKVRTAKNEMRTSKPKGEKISPLSQRNFNPTPRTPFVLSQSSKTYTQEEISQKRTEALRKRKRLECPQ